MNTTNLVKATVIFFPDKQRGYDVLQRQWEARFILRLRTLLQFVLRESALGTIFRQWPKRVPWEASYGILHCRR